MQIQETNHCLNGHIHKLKFIFEGESIQSSCRPVVIFLHGWAGSLDYWFSSAMAISKHYDCVLYDLKGFGKSSSLDLRQDHIPKFNFTDYAIDLAELLNEIEHQGKQVFIVGHSMGCSVVLHLEKLLLDKMTGLVLVCHGLPMVKAWQIQTFSFIACQIIKIRYGWLKHIPYLDRLFVSRFLSKRVKAELRLALLTDYLSADSRALEATLKESFLIESFSRLKEFYRNLSVPTFMISGEKDKIIRSHWGQLAANQNDSIQWNEMPDTGHFPMLEDPEDFIKLLENFLASHASFG